MLGIRGRLEHRFEAWAGVVSCYPGRVIAVSLLLALAPIAQIGNLVIEPNPEEFLEADHPVRARYDGFKHDYGQDQMILIALRPDDPFDPAFLEQLRDLHHTLEDEVPFVDEVNSLINARVTRGDEDGLNVDDLFEDWPETPEALARIRDYALSNPLYQDLLLNAERRLVIINVSLSPYAGDDENALAGFEAEEEFLNRENREFMTTYQRDTSVDAVREILARMLPVDREVHLAGVPVMEEQILNSLILNMGRFTALALVTIMLILGVLFRRVSGVLLPSTIALLALASTFGAAAVRGVPVEMAAQILPSLIVAITVSSAVHVLVLFYGEFDRTGSKQAAISFALGHSGLPMVFSAFTTAGGLVSFATVEITALHDLGILGPVGIAVQLLLCLSLLPALLQVLPIRRKERQSLESSTGLLERALIWCADISVTRPVTVLVIALGVTVAIGSGISRIVYIFNPLDFAPYDSPINVSTRLMNEELRGVATIEMLIDTHRENGLHEPELLKALQGLHAAVPELTDETNPDIVVGKTLSFVDILREIHQALNENRPEFHTVPDDRRLAAQELLLFENSGSDDLEDFVDSQFSRARFSIRVPWVAPSSFGSLIPKTEQAFRDALGPEVDVQVTGFLPLIATLEAAMSSVLIQSYLGALLIITPLMMLLIGSLRGGLASMIPNLTPIIVALGYAGWMGMKINIFTVTFGGIILGLAVDDTIHVFHQFYRYRRIKSGTVEAVRETMRTTGRALLTTSIVLTAGFLVFTASDFPALVDLGEITAVAVIVAFLADAFMAPALLHLLYRSRGRPIE